MEKTLTSKQHERLIELLVDARLKAGITQVQLAEKIGEYQSFVARMESGQRRVDIIELIKLSEVLGFDVGNMIEQVQAVD